MSLYRREAGSKSYYPERWHSGEVMGFVAELGGRLPFENWSPKEYTWASGGKLGCHISSLFGHPDWRSRIAALDSLMWSRISVNTTWTLSGCGMECCHVG